MKSLAFFVLAFVAITFGQIDCGIYNSSCTDCTRNGCNYCDRQINVMGRPTIAFCTDLSQGAANCAAAIDDAQDQFFTSPQACVGGCGSVTICDACSSLANGDCGWCFNAQQCIPFSTIVNSTQTTQNCNGPFLIGTCALACPDRTSCFACGSSGGDDCAWIPGNSTCVLQTQADADPSAGALNTQEDCPGFGNQQSSASAMQFFFAAFALLAAVVMF